MEQKVEREPKRRELDGSSGELPRLNTNLPEDIKIDILSWLPPKSLSRCKCVSKHWNSFLTMEAFLHSHSRSFGKHSKHGLVARTTLWRKGSVFSFELTDINTPKMITKAIPNTTGSTMDMVRGQDVSYPNEVMIKYSHMSNICNDLVCLFNPISSLMCVLNMKTHDFIDLPPPKIIRSPDPPRIWCFLGFDPTNKVFKVLIILSVIYRGWQRCRNYAAILTLGSKCWQTIFDCAVPCSVSGSWPPCWTRNNSFCLDGVIYWACDNGIHESSVLTVVAFDLSSGTFRDFKLVINVMKHLGLVHGGEFTYDYLFTFLKGRPTILNWRRESNEILEMALLNHKKPNATWSRRTFKSDALSRMLRYGVVDIGGRLLLRPEKPIEE